MGSKKEQPTTGISSQFVIIRSSCSTTSGIAREPCCGQETSTAPTVGNKSWHRRWNAISGMVCVCFAKPEIYEYLELKVIEYAIRLPANAILEQEIKHLLKRPEGELPEKPVICYHDFQYQAKSWDHPRRVVTKME